MYKHTRPFHAMDRSLKWIFSAVLIVLSIVLVSRGISGVPVAAQSNLLGASELNTLQVQSLDPRTPLRIGSEVEVYRFRINATAPFSLRYLSLFIDSEGLDESSLQEPNNWKIYSTGRNPQLLGQGESLVDQTLLVRMNSSRTQAYIGFSGQNDFVVMTTVKKTASNPRIQAGLSEQKWVWLPYAYTDSWVTLNEKWGAEAIIGLPSEVLEKTLEL